MQLGVDLFDSVAGSWFVLIISLDISRSSGLFCLWIDIQSQHPIDRERERDR